MIRSVRLAAVFATACVALLCDPFAGEATAGPRSTARKVIRHKVAQLGRKDHQLRRDIHRDQRHEKHVHAKLQDTRKFLRSHKNMKNKTVLKSERRRAYMLSRHEHQLEREIYRDKRQDRHVRATRSELVKYLHPNRITPKK